MTTDAFRARFFDGRSPVPHDVVARLSPEALRLVGEGGETVAVWSHRDLRLVDRPYRGRPLRLTSRRMPEARLTLDDDAILAPLGAQGATLRRLRTPLSRAQRGMLAIAVAAIVFVVGIVFALPDLAGPIAAMVPAELERELGARVVEEFGEGPGFCTGRAGSLALDGLAARLSAAAEAPHPITVRVADTKMVNAFAAPGGQVVLLRGLIDSARSGDEVAGVLAHEIGHVVHRHPAKAFIRRVGLLLIVRNFTGDDMAAGLGLTLMELSHSREDEAQADAAAVRILSTAGLKSDGLVGFFERMAEDEDSGKARGLLAFLSTHPGSDARRAAVAAGAGGGAAALTAGEWRALGRICGD